MVSEYPGVSYGFMALALGPIRTATQRSDGCLSSPHQVPVIYSWLAYLIAVRAHFQISLGTKQYGESGYYCAHGGRLQIVIHHLW